MLALAATMANVVHAEITGQLMNAQPMWTLQDQPVDPSLSTIAFTGKWSHNGQVVLHIYNPNTTCIPYNGQPVCGNRATDVTYTFKAVFKGGQRSYFELLSVVDNPGPQNTGIVSNVKVTGYWDKNGDVEINLSNTLEAANKGATSYAVVSMKTIYTGSVDRDNVFEGHVLVRAIPYIVSNGIPRPNPYQMVTAPYTPFSSTIVNMAIPRRALSPYAESNPAKFTGPVTVLGNVNSITYGESDAYTGMGVITTPYPYNPSTPVASLGISGTLTNVVFGVGNSFTADANIVTPNYGATFNRTGVMKGSMYQVPRYNNLYHIYAGDFTDSLGKIHIFDSADVILSC